MVKKTIIPICLLWVVTMCKTDSALPPNASEHKEWFELVSEQGSYLALTGFDESWTNFYYGTNARDSRYIDLYYYNGSTGESAIVFENTMGFVLPEGNHYSKGISQNEDVFVMIKYLSNKHSDLYAYHRKIGRLHKLNIESDSFTLLTPMRFVRNKLYYLSDYKSEFPKLFSYDFERGSSSLLLEPDALIEEIVAINDDEIAVLVNDKGSSQIAALNLNSLSTREIFRGTGYIEPGTIRYSDSLHVLTGQYSSPVEPLLEIQVDPGTNVQLSDSVAGNLKYDLISYISEGQIIHGHFIWSNEMTRDVPLVTFIHGGPEIQMPNSYNDFLIAIVKSGIAVFVPNIRGSSGYGKSFFHADDGAHDKTGPVDIKNGVDLMLNKYPFLNRDRVFLNGLSYGGYIVYHTLIQYPGVFRGGIVVNGVVDYDIALSNMPDFFAAILNMKLEEFKGPSLDYDLLDASMFVQGNKLRNKLLIFQGREDELVPFSAVDSLVKQLNSDYIKYIQVNDLGHETSDLETGRMITEKSIEFVLAR